MSWSIGHMSGRPEAARLKEKTDTDATDIEKEEDSHGKYKVENRIKVIPKPLQTPSLPFLSFRASIIEGTEEYWRRKK